MCAWQLHPDQVTLVRSAKWEEREKDSEKMKTTVSNTWCRAHSSLANCVNKANHDSQGSLPLTVETATSSSDATETGSDVPVFSEWHLFYTLPVCSVQRVRVSETTCHCVCCLLFLGNQIEHHLFKYFSGPFGDNGSDVSVY